MVRQDHTGCNFIDEQVTLGSGAQVWNGKMLTVNALKQPGAQAAVLEVHGMGGAYKFIDGNERSVYASFRVPEKFDNTKDMKVILLWDSSTVSQDCDWEVAYLLRQVDEDLTVTVPDDTLQSYEESSATASGLVHSVFTIPNTDIHADDKFLNLKITRDGNDGSDNLGDNAFLVGVMLKGVAKNLGGAV